MAGTLGFQVPQAQQLRSSTVHAIHIAATIKYKTYNIEYGDEM